MKTKSIILGFSIFLSFTFSVSGAFLRNIPQELKQPDGSILNCFATGDEFHNWLHDENNYTIIQDPNNGFYVYAEKVNGVLLPSQWIARLIDPASKGLSPGLNISKEEYLEKRRKKTHFPGFKSYNPSSNIGTMQNLVVFIRFQYQAEYNEYSSYYDNAFNGSNMVSMNSYYDVVSNNQLEINSHFFPSSNSTTVVSYQDSHPRSYYQPYNAATNPGGYRTDSEYATREHTLLKDATEFVSAEIEGLNLNLDMNNDGNVDNIVYIIQGKTDGWSDLLWPHKWAMFTYNIYLNGAKIWWYNFQLSEAFNVSVLCHEMFHSLGAPDLYRYQDRSLTPVGPWDLMAETTTPPQHMGVYMKMKYGGWINSIPSISAGGTYTLESLNDNPYAAYKIASPNSSSEYFVLEYRHKTGQYESSLSGSGLIIYRVNPAINGNAEGPPDEVYVYRPNGTNNNNGDIYSAFFSQQSNNTRFDDNSNPSCFLSNGANGGIEIRNIGQAGSTISFEVVMEGGFQAPRNLTASVSGSNVGLNWQKPLEGNGTLNAYKLFRNGNQITTINNPETTSYNDNNLADGNYNYFVKAVYTAPSGESAESNVATASIGGSGLPDLVISEASVSPLAVDPGGDINVSCKLVNNGSGRAGASMLRLFLSKDQQYDGADESLAYGTMDALDPGNYLDITGDGLSIPENITVGNWYVLFIADADEQVNESAENNNIAAKAIDIGSSGFEPPRNLTASASGNTVNLSWQQPEQGNGTLIGYKIYRNGDMIMTIDDPGINGFSDPELANGSYSYYVTALYTSPQGESGASNEVNVNITENRKADLIVSSPTVSKTGLEAGGNFDISCRYENIGNGAAGASILRLFFSRDQILDGTDVHFAYGEMDPLNPGESIDITGEGLTVPEELDSGNWYVLYVADADENVSESNEDNNINYLGVTIASNDFYPPLNLNASAGQNTVSLFWESPHSGSENLSGYKIYRNDQLIRTIGDPETLEYTDSGLSNGYYIYYITATYSSPSGESQASNSIDVSITSADLPDFTIINQSVTPAELDPGDLVAIACYLVNNGTAQAGASTLRVFLSRDLVKDNEDIEIAYGGFDELDAGYYYDISGSDILIPENLPQGIWQVLFVADADKEVSESIENNNTSAVQITVGSVVFNPPRNLTANSSGRDVLLSWDKPYEGNGILAGYNVYRNGSFIALINDPDVFSYRDGSLNPGTYRYYVTAVYMNPSGQSAGSNQVSITISSETKPDLVILDPSVSPNVIEPGGLLDVSCSLANIGTAEAGESVLLVLLSRDQNLDAGDPGIAYGAMDRLGAGEYSDITGSGLELPSDLEPGMWYVAFVADADLDVDESNENNNVAFVPLEIEISGFNPPKNLTATVSGNNVVLNWQTPDTGNGTLSAFNVYRNGQRVTQINNPSSNSYSDEGLSLGNYNYYVTAVYVSPAGESNSSNVVSIEISSSGEPDLVITDPIADPVQLSPGETVSVYCVLRNLGSSIAGGSMVRILISKDQRADNQDHELAYGMMEAVGPGSYIEVGGNDLSLPSSVTNGLWYMIFVADADDDVLESDEQNNTALIMISVGESLFNPPENLQAAISGNSVELSWNSPKPGQGVHIGYNIYRNGDVIETIDVSSNQPYIDPNLGFDTYSYWITALYYNPDGESDPSNEVIISVSGDDKPDLIIRNAIVSPTYLDPGGIVSISCDLINTGSSIAGSSHLRLFLSKNDVLDFSDQSLAYGSIEPLESGSVINITGEDLYIPEDVDPGEWYIIFLADADAEITESSEDNNTAVVQIGVASKKPDLVITRIYLVYNYANPGEMMRLTIFIYNSGLGVTATTKVSFYLSDDEILDNDDVYLNDIAIKRMHGKEQIFKNNYVPIPSNAERKKYYLIANVDVSQLVEETDETNNTFAIPINVGATGIDQNEINSQFKVYPTIANNQLFLRYDGQDKGRTRLNIYDQLGRIVFSDNIDINGFWLHEMDISGWNKGLYFITLTGSEKQHKATFIKH